ncbi:hypothetical protein JNW88_07490 [Micromonospora sp. ATA32]|nr:hypothetical protein [Micromonospora sp. ATA32]
MQVEMHPSTAAARGITAGDWVCLDTPHGRVRARARLNPSLDPQVVFAQHGWWDACDELAPVRGGPARLGHRARIRPCTRGTRRWPQPGRG